MSLHPPHASQAPQMPSHVRNNPDGLNLAPIDPAFIQNVLSLRGSVESKTDYWRSVRSNPHPQLKQTNFQLQLAREGAKALWPEKSCLFSVFVRNDETCVRRLLVWQGNGVLICAVCETGSTFDVIAGNFFSGDDLFALDRQSEMHAIGYHKLAKRMIIQDTVEVLAPMASYDLGLDLGRALAERLVTASAEGFLDGLFAAMLSKVKPEKAQGI